MLPEFGSKLDGGLPRQLVFVRDLEAFEGPILSEYRAVNGGAFYVEKWCVRDGEVSRYLLVRSEPRAIAEFLGGKLSMLKLLTESSDGIGFVFDRRGDLRVDVRIAPLADLPRSYFPKATRMHDEALRPEWDIVPQNYLLDTQWDAKLLATIERHYLNAAGFAYLTKPGTDRRLPGAVLHIDYDGGYSVMHAFNAVRGNVPEEARSKSTGVSVNSPGVLTIETPAETASQLSDALKALSRSAIHYQAIHGWSRLNPESAYGVPDVARDNIEALCAALGVDSQKLFPIKFEADKEKDSLLVAGKLIAAYYRVLLRVLDPVDGVEFVSVRIEERPELESVDLQDEETEQIAIGRRRR
jgi:hypothetical protein